MMRGAMPAWAALICVAWVCLMLPTSVYAFVIMEATVTGAIPPEQADIARGWLASSNTYSTSFTISTSAFTSGAGIGAAIVAAANTIQASAVFGLYDDAAIEAASTTLGNLVLFGPYSQSMEVRKWSNQLYFMTADPMAELISLLNYAVSMDAAGTANLGTIGWMYLTGVAGATTEPLSTAFYNQVSQLGYNTPVAYTADASSAFNSAADFFALNPSSIFIFGQRGEHTTSFVTALGKTTNLINNKFIAFAPFALLQSLSGGSGSLTSNNMVFSSLVPPPKSTTYAAATAFTKAITASYNGMPGTYLGSVGGLYAFYGWIAMEQAIYAINLYGSTSGTPNPTGLQTALFMQNRYVIGNDYILGDYGGSCGNSVVGATTGAACECNQGGRYVAIITVSAGAVTKKSETTYPRFDCYTKANAVGGPSLAVSMFSLSDDATSSYLNQQVQNAFTAVTAVGAAQTYLLQSKQSMSFASMPVTTTADAAAGLTSFAQPKLLSAVAGPLPAGFNPANYSNILFIEPMFSDTGALSLSLDNVIYVTATLEQQIYVLASYIADRIGLIAKPNPNDPKYTETMEMRTANAVVRTADPDPLLDVIEKSVNQFGLPLSNKTAVAAGDSLISAMGKNGFYFVFGLTAAEIPELLTFLTDNLQAVVFVSFNDITNLYSNFESTFDTAPVATLRRLFFATDVITWTATSNAADIVEKYIGNSPVIYQTPASVRGFIAAIALDRATQGIANNNGKTIFNNFMNIQSFSVGNNGYGPYYRTCPTTPADYPSACLKNYGGRNIAVLAWRNLVDDSFPLPKIRSSPSLVYTADVVTSTTTRTSTIPPCSHRPQTRKPAPKHSGMIAGLILLSLLLLLLILLVLWLCCISCFCCSNTDSQNASVAPTDATKPVTMIYISVYKWAEVSSAAPEASSQALSELRNLVRRVVAKNKCYEVGTLNDAFIVASRVARDGVRMAMELQQGMRGVGGVGQSDIDRAYYSLLKEGPGTGKGAMHGLRLRVGIHTDQVDIRLDPTTGVYQYRGPGVILSAFTNRLAHGGQILVTENTCNSFSERELNKLETIPIGAQRYPDIREPVNVYEVVAVPGRKHPAARPETAPSTTADLLSEMPLVCATFKETEGGDNADMGKLNKTIQVVLRVLYSTFPVADRIELLQHLCREASLKELKRSNFATDDAFSNALIDLLSMRAATFVITAADVTRAKGGVANNTMGMTSPAKGGDFSPVESEMQQFEDPKKPAMQEEYAYPNEGTDERVQARNAAMADVSSDSSSFHL